MLATGGSCQGEPGLVCNFNPAWPTEPAFLGYFRVRFVKGVPVLLLLSCGIPALLLQERSNWVKVNRLLKEKNSGCGGVLELETKRSLCFSAAAVSKASFSICY